MPELQNRRVTSTRGLPLRVPQLAPASRPPIEQQVALARQHYARLTELWTAPTGGQGRIAVPVNHQIRLIEAIRELPLELMNKVMAKEIREMEAGTA